MKKIESLPEPTYLLIMCGVDILLTGSRPGKRRRLFLFPAKPSDGRRSSLELLQSVPSPTTPSKVDETDGSIVGSPKRGPLPLPKMSQRDPEETGGKWFPRGKIVGSHPVRRASGSR